MDDLTPKTKRCDLSDNLSIIGDNFRWYASNLKSLCSKYKEKIGYYCIVSNDEIKFSDEKLDSMESAFKYFRQKYPDLKGPLITLFGIDKQPDTIFSSPISPSCEKEDTNVQTLVKNANFVSNFMWICDNQSKINEISSKWLAIFDNNLIELSVKDMNEAFLFLRENKFPFGAIVLHSNDFRFARMNSFDTSKYFAKKQIIVDLNCCNKTRFINNILFDTGADVVCFKNWKSISIQEEVFFGIGYSSTISGSCLQFFVDHLKICIPGLPFRKTICSFPCDYNLIYELFNLKTIEKAEKLSEFDKNSIFTITDANEVNEWLKKDYEEPSELLKKTFEKCGVMLWPSNLTINGLLGQTYLRQVNYKFEASDQSLFFSDGQNISEKFL